MRPREWLRLLASMAVALLAFAVPRASLADGAPEGACLSPAVGDAISRKLAAHAFDAALPVGWTIGEVGIRSEQVDVELSDDTGSTQRVSLLPRATSGGVRHDGEGASFVFVLGSGATPLDAAGRRTLLALAALVDASVPASAIPGCAPSIRQEGWLEHGALAPRTVALSTGALEVLVVCGALAFVARSRRTTRPLRPSSRCAGWALRIAVFAASLTLIRTGGGASPILWLDTLNDQRDAIRCVTKNACTTLGEAASVEGVHHGVGWLDLLSLATLAGLRVEHVHLLMQVLCAIGAVLAASLATRVGGWWAGAVTLLAFLGFIPRIENQLPVYNTSILPFLGAVLLVVAMEALERPRPSSVALTAAIAAILASVHAACVLAGLSAVAIALQAPKGRLKLAFLASLIFAGAAFAIGPGTWLSNAHHVFARLGGHGSSGWSPGAALSPYGLFAALALAMVAWTWRSASHEARCAARACAAIALPMLVASIAADTTSSLRTDNKYLAHAAACGAVTASLVVGLSVDALGHWLAIGRDTSRRRILAVLGHGFALLALAPRAVDVASPPSREASITLHEAGSISRELAARGWTYARAFRGLRSRESAVMLPSFGVLTPDLPAGPAGDDPTSVYVVKGAASSVPDPLPQDWVVAEKTSTTAVLLVFARSALSFSHYDVCPAAADGTCARSGLLLEDDQRPACAGCLPGMPPVDVPRPYTLLLRFPVVPGAAGTADAIYMPRHREICGGTIASLPAGSGAISADGRRATWAPPAEGRASVELRWELGAPECTRYTYSGMPPFFLEGPPQTVEALVHLGVEL